MKQIVIALLIFLLANSAEFPSYYTYAILPMASYKCIKQAGYSRMLLWIESTQDSPQPIKQEGITNLFNSNNMGLPGEIYMTPCRARQAMAQAQVINKYVGKQFQNIWIYPQNSYESCSWFEYSAESNCAYLQNFVTQMKNLGKNVGIVGNKPYWTKVFQTADGCPQVSNLNMIWIPDGSSIDHQPNFNSYKQIGGWKKPSGKLYGSKWLCGEPLSLIYYE